MLLYIDPGTGSMLFAAVLGIVSSLYYLLQQLWVRFKYRGRVKEADTEAKGLVLFGESGQYWKVFKPVCDELEKRGVECEYYTMDEKDAALASGYKHVHVSFIGSDNRAFARLNLLKARVFLATTPGLNVYQWKRSPNVDRYVHIFHDATEGTGYRMFGMDDYDTILLTGAFQEEYIRKLEKLRNEKPKEVILAGSTYLDALLEKKRTYKWPEGKKERTVLLAPSWGESGILTRFGEKIIRALLGTGYHIIVRPHPQTFKSEKDIIEALMKTFPADDRLEWDCEHDNFDSLSRADVMITDYSGVMFDYMLIFDRPIMYADVHMDKAPYDAAWLDEPVWHLEILPELGILLKEENFDRIKEQIDELLSSDTYAANRKRIGEIVWQERGKAAKNVVDQCVKFLNEAKETEERKDGVR